jgi:hypothetical protein
VNEPELSITEEWSYDYVQHYVYMYWYYKREMTTIWYRMNTDEQLSQLVPYLKEPMDELAHIPHLHQNVWAIIFFLFKLFI